MYRPAAFGYSCAMTSQEAIAVLVRHRADLEARGVRHAALFGSVARGEARPDSDLDILIELDPDAKLDIFDYAGIRRYIAELFATGSVDVVDRAALRPHVRPSAESDAVYAF
jgi:predicted nucleotidyltransferase